MTAAAGLAQQPGNRVATRSAAAAFLADARRIATTAWPVLVGQLAVLAFSTVDTLLVARHAAVDLAALAIGAAAYISIFIGLMGVVLAIGPIVGQLHGAGDDREAGRQWHQSLWVALGLSVVGCSVLLFPQPFLSLSQASPEVAAKVRDYLGALAVGLPPALLFTAYRGFNVAVSRPKAVMLLQLGGLALKIPLSVLLVGGVDMAGLPVGLSLTGWGVAGCGMATAVVMWLQWLAALALLRTDRFYRRFEFDAPQGWKPHRASLVAFLRLGLPMGSALLVEVTGFTFMAFFIARLGTHAVAGHQIAANLVALLFMVPLSLSHATGALVAQRIGAADLRDARSVGWHGLQLALLVAALLGSAVLLLREAIAASYTPDPAVIGAALPLIGWVAAFHLADAAQALAAGVLRAWRITALPLLVYVVAVWGVGLGCGYLLAFGHVPMTPAQLHGAMAFWAAATVGLWLAAGALGCVLLRVGRRSGR